MGTIRQVCLRLPEGLLANIDKIVGPGKRSEFIRESLEQAVRREMAKTLIKFAGCSKNNPNWVDDEAIERWHDEAAQIQEERTNEKWAGDE